MQKKSTRDTRDFGDKLSETLGVERKSYNNKSFRPRTDAPRYNPKSQERYQNNRKFSNHQQDTSSFQLPDKRKLGEDGIDHINCSSMATTTIGKFLSSHANANFQHRFAGPFRSIESFVWYLRTEDDAFRTLPGYLASRKGRSIAPQELKDVSRDLERLLVADAYWGMVNAREDIAEEIKKSTAPFDVYNIDQSGIRIRIFNANWQAHTFELIREGLKNGHYPHFYKLFNDNTAYGKDYVNAQRANFKLGESVVTNADAAPAGYNQSLANAQYEELMNAIVKFHFEGLIDYNQLLAFQTRNVKQAALKASKQILNNTQKDVDEFQRKAFNKKKKFKQPNKEQTEQTTSNPTNEEVLPAATETTLTDLSVSVAAEVQDTLVQEPVQEAAAEQPTSEETPAETPTGVPDGFNTALVMQEQVSEAQAGCGNCEKCECSNESTNFVEVQDFMDSKSTTE